LKKQPDFPCCKVLKSLALMRMGRETEAVPILDSVLEESPTDESTLQAMNIAYKELQLRGCLYQARAKDEVADIQ
jgi:N-terminal acetyltransferase B complex non-catalytic subunit